MTGKETLHLFIWCILLALSVVVFSVWFIYNYPSYAESQDIQPIEYHTNTLISACHALDY